MQREEENYMQVNRNGHICFSECSVCIFSMNFKLLFGI